MPNDPEAPRGQPLGGIRVADFSRVLAGPLATMVLADLGADVIKVERPETGDDTRGWGPPFLGDEAAYFLSLNRNKRSIVLDLATDEGRTAARRLALSCDVVVENFRPGLMERFGLHHATLSAERPDIVSCSLTAFADGEGGARPGYDIIVQAMSGLMSFTGHPGEEPTKVGVAVLDVICGLYAASAIQAALLGRRESGRGAHVTVSLFDASLAALVNQAANYLIGGIVPGPMGNQHPNIVPYQLFEAADRPFILAAGNDRLFERTCAVAGRPELAHDDRFATNEARVRHRDVLIPLLAEAFASRSADEWLAELTAAAVPCAPVRRLDEVFKSPAGLGAIQEVDDPVRGTLRLVADPIRVDGATSVVRRPPPRLGEHTDQVRAQHDRHHGGGGPSDGGSADPEARGERPQGQSERDEGREREGRPRPGLERLLSGEQVRDPEDHERPEAVDVVQPGGRPAAGKEQDRAEERLCDRDDLRHREPAPEPVPGLPAREQQDEAEQPPDGEQPDDQVTDELVEFGHGGRILRARPARRDRGRRTRGRTAGR